MTDRELLEAAAKAAGLKLNTYPDEDFVRADHSGLGQHWNPRWNPLADDGDALRLAVMLRLPIDYINEQAIVSGLMASGMDANESTRRAIVRAAAAKAGNQS